MHTDPAQRPLLADENKRSDMPGTPRSAVFALNLTSNWTKFSDLFGPQETHAANINS